MKTGLTVGVATLPLTRSWVADYVELTKPHRSRL